MCMSTAFPIKVKHAKTRSLTLCVVQQAGVNIMAPDQRLAC